MKAFTLRIGAHDGSSNPHAIEISRDCTIGREGADILIADPHCSRKHATLQITTEGILVNDLGSRNGVFVQGRRVQVVFLRPGDSMRLGSTLIEVLAPATEPIERNWPGQWLCLPAEKRAQFKEYL